MILKNADYEKRDAVPQLTGEQKLSDEMLH